MSREVAIRRNVAARRRSPLVAVRRYDMVREAACEQCGIAYGPIVASLGRRESVFYPQPDGTERMTRQTAVRVTYEICETGARGAGFLTHDTQKIGREEGYHTRMAMDAVRRSIGQVEPPR